MDELALLARAQAAVRPATRRAGRTWITAQSDAEQASVKRPYARADEDVSLAVLIFATRRAVSSYLEVKIQTPGGLRDHATAC